jgi:diacylglycerol kinase family enzyme
MGGDGSIGSMLDKFSKVEVIRQHLDKLIFVPLPYGTGNDLSRALGWGGSEGMWAKSLETLVWTLLNREKDKLTIWEIEFDATVMNISGNELIPMTFKDESGE